MERAKAPYREGHHGSEICFGKKMSDERSRFHWFVNIRLPPALVADVGVATSIVVLQVLNVLHSDDLNRLNSGYELLIDTRGTVSCDL